MFIYFHITKDLIYIPIFVFINLIIKWIIEYSNIKYDFLSHICDVCLIIFYLLEKYLIKDNNNDYYIKINKIPYKMILLLISSIILLCIDNFSYFDGNIKIADFEDSFLIIFFLILIELIFFNKTFYRHQILSIIVLFIFYVYFLVKNYINVSLKLYYVIYLLQFYCYSFSLHLIKYTNTQYFISIYLLGSIHGIFLLIQDLIQKSFLSFPKINLLNILIIILFFFILLVNNFLYYKIIEKLGPIYLFMSESISYFLIYLINSSFEFIPICLIVIISCLIYLEILELNFCSLNKNTKKNIENRAQQEIIIQLNISKSIYDILEQSNNSFKSNNDSSENQFQ